MTLQINADAIVGDIVATDFRTAAVFERLGIDFCCGGRRTMADACRSANLDLAAVTKALAEASRDSVAPGEGVAAWSVERLIDHIVARHHTYVRDALPAIDGYLVSLLRAHGERHPELNRLAAVFSSVRQGMEQHMMKEEQVLFPYIRGLAGASSVDGPGCPFGTVQNPIRMMEHEHQAAADEVREMRALTGGYAVPADGCATYSVCMAELARFEEDLHQHVHLENNVLFPKAVAIEQDDDDYA